MLGRDGDHPDCFSSISLEGLFLHASFHSFLVFLFLAVSSAMRDNANRVGSMNAPE